MHGAELDDDEISEALKIKVREVNVFGEKPLEESEAQILPFAEVFRPSRAFPGSAGTRTSLYEDSETFLYLAVYNGDGHAFVGRKKAIGDKSEVLKIGVSNAPSRRCGELNAGIPHPTRNGTSLNEGNLCEAFCNSMLQTWQGCFVSGGNNCTMPMAQMVCCFCSQKSLAIQKEKENQNKQHQASHAPHQHQPFNIGCNNQPATGITDHNSDDAKMLLKADLLLAPIVP